MDQITALTGAGTGAESSQALTHCWFGLHMGFVDNNKMIEYHPPCPLTLIHKFVVEHYMTLPLSNQGHSSFITHLDWSKDGKYIMSNSGDYEILYWDIAAGCKLLRNRFESKDREWASYTCVLGFHVMGVWLEGSDGTDINALCRSHSERMVAVADDFCKVHLFQYPCPKPKAPSHKYDGHGSHVTNVCFTHSDSHLLSMGGKDTCILQWRVMGGGSGDSRERLGSVSASSTSTNCPEPATS